MFNFNRNFLAAAALIILIVIIFSFLYFVDLDLKIFNWLNNIIYNLITPVLNILHQLVEVVKNFFVTLFSIDEVNQEIKDLRQKNSVLERQILFLENINRENERLRELLNFKKEVEYEMLGAEVIANSPSIWEKTITINRGSRDGVKNRMPVITYQGYLVGRIENTGSSAAQVRLITDREFVVGGVVARTNSRVIGLIRGSGREDQPNIMDNIAWDADLEADDVILTSGLSNNFPAGLKIGKVIDVETDNYGLSQKANIDLYINNLTVEEVMIIKDFNQETAKIKENKAENNLTAESEADKGIKENEKN